MAIRLNIRPTERMRVTNPIDIMRCKVLSKSESTLLYLMVSSILAAVIFAGMAERLKAASC